MRTLGPLFLATVLAGCMLSPGHDLPSSEKSTNDGSESPIGDGDTFPIGDGDVTTLPPGMVTDVCGESGGGGMGGAPCEDTPEP